MFTQLVIIISIICVAITANKILEKRKMINYPGGLSLPLGLFSVAFAIFAYGIRDILIQLDKYDLQFIFYQIGGIAQIVGFFLVGIFVSGFLTKKFLRKIILLFWAVYSIAIIIAVLFFPVRIIVKQAILEPFPYKVISLPWESGMINIFFLAGTVVLSLFIFCTFLYNFINIKERNGKLKTFFYGMGLFCLFLPAILCVFISPIFGRLGYVIGAICILFAFRIKTP